MEQIDYTNISLNEKLPLVSVIIPAYNAEKYVEHAVRSIMNQTYKNLEILVTDDCSTDNTLDILQKLAEEDARISIHHNEQNKKIVQTLNELVERAKGKYIARMDADDLALHNRIEKQIDYLETHSEIGICGTNAWHINESDKIIGISRLPETNEEIQKFKIYKCPLYHPSVVVRKDLLFKNRYDERYIHSEDYELWVRLSTKTKIYNLKERLLYYRIHTSQISKKYTNEQVSLGKEILQNYDLIPQSMIYNLSKVFYENKQLSKPELKVFKQFSKNLVTNNPWADLVLFIYLIKTKNICGDLFWVFKESFFLLLHLVQSKLLVRICKIKN